MNILTSPLWATALPCVALGLSLHRTSVLFGRVAPRAQPFSLVLCVGVSGLAMVWAASALSQTLSAKGLSPEYLEAAQMQGPAMTAALAMLLYGPELLGRVWAGTCAVFRRLFFLSK